MPRVLIAEDDPLIARLMREVLSDAGYEIECVEDGTAVCTVTRGFRPDVLLLDLGLPGRHGTHVLDDLQAAPELCEIPVIVVTAWWTPDLREQVVAAGAVDAVEKPFSPATLLAAVEAARSGVHGRISVATRPVPTTTQ